jgi:hypothetical protein
MGSDIFGPRGVPKKAHVTCYLVFLWEYYGIWCISNTPYTRQCLSSGQAVIDGHCCGRFQNGRENYNCYGVCIAFMRVFVTAFTTR